jgi:hypothetical protein
MNSSREKETPNTKMDKHIITQNINLIRKIILCIYQQHDNFEEV